MITPLQQLICLNINDKSGFSLLFLETNYCKNEIIRKQKHSNGKTKHKTIDGNLQKPTTYILQQRSVVKMYFIIMINLEIKKTK